MRLCANYFYEECLKLPSGFLSPLWTLTQLRGLTFYSRGVVFLDQLEPETGLSNLTNLEELELSDCRLIDMDNREWMINYNELSDLKKLTKLEITDVNAGDKLIDIIANMTQLVQLEISEILNHEHKLDSLSNLKNLTQISLDINLSKSDPGLNFAQMTKLEVVSVLWFPNVTQLIHSKKLRKLTLEEGYHKTNEQALNFLNELGSLKELNIAASILPDDRIVDMKGMTNLMYLAIKGYKYNEREKSAICSKSSQTFFNVILPGVNFNLTNCFF